jgi:serine phosphatase RsbU (regulator of sigma subunit)
MRTYGWRKWTDPIFESLIAILVGVAVTMVEGGGKHQMPEWPTFVRNAILGVAILIDSRGLETMLSWAIEQSRIPTVFRTLVYALGAWLGFFSGLLVVASLFGAEDDDFRFHTFHAIYSLTAAALIAVVMGFIFHHNRKRNDRLRQTIERLKEHEFAEKELEIARSVQQRLMPPPEIDAGAFHVSARTEAAHIIGGDFYDVVRLDDGSVSVLIADVSGKGIAASLIMASCKAAIPFLAMSPDPVRVLEGLNARLCADLQKREFVAMALAHFPLNGTASLVNAGMPDPLLLHSDGRVEPLSCGGDRLPLGLRRSVQYAATSFDLRNGDRLLMFSDGLAEAAVNGEPIGYDRVHELAARARSVDDLLAAVRSGATVDDDATGVLISRSPEPQLQVAALPQPA